MSHNYDDNYKSTLVSFLGLIALILLFFTYLVISGGSFSSGTIKSRNINTQQSSLDIFPVDLEEVEDFKLVSKKCYADSATAVIQNNSDEKKDDVQYYFTDKTGGIIESGFTKFGPMESVQIDHYFDTDKTVSLQIQNLEVGFSCN